LLLHSAAQSRQNQCIFIEQSCFSAQIIHYANRDGTLNTTDWDSKPYPSVVFIQPAAPAGNVPSPDPNEKTLANAAAGRPKEIQTGTKLYISNLDYNVSDDDIKVRVTLQSYWTSF
jgi:hypothetical protein